MNIHALLSPHDSPNKEGSSSDGSTGKSMRPPGPSPKFGGASKHRPPSTLSQEVRHTPEQTTSNPPSRPSTANNETSPQRPQQAFPLPHFSRAAAPTFRPLYQQPPPHQISPTSHPAQTQNASSPDRRSSVPSFPRPIVAHRPSSTPQLDVLSDLSQRQQTARTHSATSVRQLQSGRTSRASSFAGPSSQPPLPQAPIFRNSSSRSMADLAMAEAAAQPPPPPRTFESRVLSDSESRQVTDLLNYINENSYAYESHVELINLLHKGFLAHVRPPIETSDQRNRDPKTYPLLKPLRQAREAMDTRFAVGEDLWDDWLSDEILLASSSEERIAVTELFAKAVQDEPTSVKLWQMYAGWIWIIYTACNAPAAANQAGWTDEDREVCKEVFTRDMVINVLEQAIGATQWRVDESHVVWNRYSELVQEDFPATPSAAEIERLRNMYVNRLQFPHASWEETSQMFWSIVSKYEGGNWEAIMADVQGLTSQAKTQMGLREPHEYTLRRAMESGDKSEIFNQFSQYLQWERKHERKQKQRSAFDRELRCALYERALLRFPTYTEWWLDYVDFVTTSNTSTSPLPLLERATRHCPWSGDLWSRRILQSDVENRPHAEIEATKHRATNSGLLDIGGMEEMVKVLQQWCSYLRRNAFRTVGVEDDLDTAEVGITAALEDVSEAGKKIYGKEFQGDPLYRLESIQIKFLSEARRFKEAREIYQKLAQYRKDSYDFWASYYNWELWIWGYDRIKDKHRIETTANGPHKATAVVQEALSQRNLDWPEKVLEMYLNHFQQHESGERLRAALVDAREFSKHLQYRRTREAEEAAPAVQQPQTQIVDAPVLEAPVAEESNSALREKRKRDEEILPNGHNEKRLRFEEPARTEPTVETAPTAPAESSSSASAQVKRDREHNTISVKNLPADVEELDIKKFFRQVGVPRSITILANKDNTATATVEFESHEDVLAAKTRNGKDLKGNEVRIQGGTQSTLYVANYPPEYDEPAIRKLFEGHGEIVAVRLPSLKFDNRRRFCYVQFLTGEMAKAAEVAMDGKMLDEKHKLLAKVSDPDAKKQRSGPQAEGRELYVKNVNREASDDDIKKFFEQYGTVVGVNSIKLVSGKRTGTVFVVFSNTDEANAALAANDKSFQDRNLHVELSSAKGRAAPLERARKEDIIVNQAKSASPEPSNNSNGRRGSDVSMASASTPQPIGDESWKTARERKIAIFNLPDTVNDARIRAAMEEHGPLVKIQLRRDKLGAIVEFANVQDAFNVRQGVDCSSLGAEVKTGDVSELFAKGKKPPNTVGGATKDSGMMRPPQAISRPAQRGGRRGGLGFKRGGGSTFGGARQTNASAGVDEDDDNITVKPPPARSNDDFRNLFNKGKEEADKEGAKEKEDEEGKDA